MTRRRLTNEMWGLETSCFVCEPTNTAGLALAFFADDDAGTVESSFRLGAEHSGAPTLIHGGVSLAILDEAQAWAVIALGRSWAVTHTTQATFDRPVFVDVEYRVVARLDGPVADDPGRLATHATVIDAEGNELVRSSSEFVVLGEAQAVAFGAGGIVDEHRDLLRSEEPDLS